MSEALWVAVVGLIGAIVGYLFNAWTDRTNRRADRNLVIHVEMMEAIGRLASSQMGAGDEREAQQFYAIAKLKFSVVASDDAIRELGKLEGLFSKQGKKSPQEINQRVASLMRAARNDIHSKTRLTDVELLGASPFVNETEPLT